MGDPFSIAAGVVGILAPTVHCTRVLLDDLQNISDAPEVVEDLKGDLRSVDLTLKSLRAVKEAEWATASPSTLEQSKMIITSCKDSCTKLKADLDRWTKHSSSGRLSWQDRATVGFWKQSRIKSMSKQLQKYQIALNLVASTATLSVYPSELTKNSRELMDDPDTTLFEVNLSPKRWKTRYRSKRQKLPTPSPQPTDN
ncbi:hypothetical protein K449DRAFT_328007 [Hypoxylon sp. EC38]|nr:hypothetical protein K449DRAFT_328007 [Hypoxylon sp. EC38]